MTKPIETLSSRDLSIARKSLGIDRQGRSSPRLREVRFKLDRLRAGQTETLSIGVFGDSWTQSPARGIQHLAKRLQTAFGMAGGGYMGFSYPAAGLSFLFAGARPDLYTIAQSGTWTSNHTGQNQPDMGRVSSSSVGAKYTITFPAGHSAANLFYNNSAGAEVRYRWDGGSWTTLSLASGTFASLASVPTGSGTLEIEVVAGTCQLGGIDWRMSASGVRLHKLGASGGRASQFASLGEPNWRTSVANLGIDAAVLMLGINDKAADRTPTEFATDIQTIITRLRTMDSAIDILLVAEPETSSAIARPDIYTQAEYAEELATLAEANRCGFLDLQPFFGTAPSEYNFASSLALLQSDGTHVSEDKGAFIVSAALYDAIAG